MSFHVYLLIGDDGTPIYVGASTNVDNRLRTHRNDKTVYDALGGRTKHQATQRVDLVECTDYDDMMSTESILIKRHKPVVNVAGKGYDPAKFAAHVAGIVAAAPPLTDQQRNDIAALLRVGA